MNFSFKNFAFEQAMLLQRDELLTKIFYEFQKTYCFYIILKRCFGQFGIHGLSILTTPKNSQE